MIKFEKTLHTTLETLRSELRNHSTQLKIVKNSLLSKALNKLSQQDSSFQPLAEDKQSLRENSALLLLSDEWSKGLGAFQKFREKELTLFYKVGILDKQVYHSDDLTRIAKLPSKDELIAKVIGNMKTPISSFNFALKFNLQKFVYVLSEKSKQSN
ncbi:50S ribosomal protein L10 [Candidatus Roizmanbacteria bacterium]|nr:50S ribosomal protein L10 [Candidatus Roizmanbacteria bacterium]